MILCNFIHNLHLLWKWAIESLTGKIQCFLSYMYLAKKKKSVHYSSSWNVQFCDNFCNYSVNTEYCNFTVSVSYVL